MAPLKRKQLNIFGTYTKTFNVRLKYWSIKLKEGRGLMTKLLTVRDLCQRFNKVSLITDISKLMLKELLSHPRTKNSLTKIFTLKAIELLNQEKKIYVVGYQKQIDWTQFSHLYEEADTLILCVVREITLLNPQSSIFIKMVSLWHRRVCPQCPSPLHTATPARTGYGVELYIKFRRLISVNKCIAGLGEQKARALLGLHVFSGCNQVGEMSTITKARVMKLFMLPLTTHADSDFFL